MSSGKFAAIQLKGEYDVDRLLAELQELERTQWAAQRTYGESLEPGEATLLDWRVLSLRSPEGDGARTDPGGFGLVEYAPTPWLDKAPYIASILDAIPTELRSVRLMSLGVGAEVDEHRDVPYGLPAGWVRLHIPLVTNDRAVCTLGGEKHTWQPGTFWYGDFSRPHSVRNDGDERRVHMVIDAYVNQELLELFPAEFRDAIRWSDVLLNRPELPLADHELPSFAGTFALPDAFLYGESEELAAAGDEHTADAVSASEDREGRIRVAGDRLVLDVDGEPRAALVHLGEGEFRALGWTAERTLKIEPEGTGGPRVRLRMRWGSRMEEVVRASTPAAA
ncbi:aspartyl/asparaginyl beta-hydroxylase domain-containing protein [Streptomyces sp. KE1]|uniref:aspartyl/asparaginyl beta-hydroxylase domain-containing protein n=1 Tax=Streptomyces sp. KE1 TaxID=1638939 RepID=UPI00063ECEE2|nr:aspartyl/asparaginyl beta-hydroxylase domain-containing protein [Streptomyces sp. KE1]KLJ01166.1 asparaginyl beta-hydroxylase [Streptomyces sp. KE1]